ncbi:acyl-CoA dehydrogenase family protein [Actinophytocola algeriensis]|uniref:Alkylation response protein AidB-like acyl-CoA dehydrogenase n=1 Tax=Actinophytocola algeriensis TaxID=1768010 RepID=A0A7W7Q964_9PSEU|nr:acyl-CoA dehydrogenase family protein [Actinophytocola algeriensis]MBB4909365.1 alkylation response protein AidB-like acyl-CoA dehydrogenase [Actinophytocola algeriensis]MBE1475355.1 alkylation response protein AidB-like acyl-CoA dehydrogenase [Actinophytocola algeriensis]
MRTWSAEQRDLRIDFADKFAAWGEGHLERDRTGTFPWEQWKQVGESGLLKLPFDPAWGGLGQDLLTTMYVLEGLGYGCRDNGLNSSVATQLVSTGIPLHRFGTTEQKDRFLRSVADGTRIGAHAITERHGGSDAASMKSTAVRDGDNYVINGEKCFISNGPVADLFLLYVRTQGGTGPFGISTFLVERNTPGLGIGEVIDKMGLRTTPFCNITFDDVVVPASNMVGKLGKGFLILDYVMKWEVLCAFVLSLGNIRNRLERCIEFARSRTQFGAKIGSYQSISNKIVDMKIGLETSRKWLYDTAEDFLAGENVMMDLAIAKLMTSEANVKSAADAVQIFGGRGYLTEFGLEKDLRDATGGTIYSGTSEIQRDKISRILRVS